MTRLRKTLLACSAIAVLLPGCGGETAYNELPADSALVKEIPKAKATANKPPPAPRKTQMKISE